MGSRQLNSSGLLEVCAVLLVYFAGKDNEEDCVENGVHSV